MHATLEQSNACGLSDYLLCFQPSPNTLLRVGIQARHYTLGPTVARLEQGGAAKDIIGSSLFDAHATPSHRPGRAPSVRSNGHDIRGAFNSDQGSSPGILA